jgi:hypothetical protein
MMNINSENQASLKYQYLIDEIDLNDGCTCPPENAEASHRIAFRYVFENDPNLESHKPGRLKNPKRVGKTGDESCSLCSISCFETVQQAITKYRDLVNTRPNLANVLGDSLAMGELDEMSGLVTEIDEHGHFDLFEFSTFDPFKRFIFIQKIELSGNN